MKIALISLGCAKNLVDSEHMLALLQENGLELVAQPEEADVAVINTCGFIESAKQEAIEQIFDMVRLKDAGILRGIVVTGCLSQRYREEFSAEIPEVDAVLGTGSYDKIVEAVLAAGQKQRFEDFSDINESVLGGPRIVTTPGYSAYLKIAEGCDNHCAYCVIPSLRGRYRSRPMEELLEEAQELADSGVRELMIVAQDITRYGTDRDGKRRLGELLQQLCRMDFTWIRLHYLYPDELEESLIEIIASEPKIVKYLDIPIQHASDRILSAMNRRGNRQQLQTLLRQLREKIDGLVLRTSLIVGFPGETAEDFEELCDFLQEAKIERAGVFSYSAEEGTPAAEMPCQVDEDTKQRRQFVVEEIQSRIIDQYNQGRIGQRLTVLCEGYDEEQQQYYGRSYADSPEIDGKIFFSSDKMLSPGEFVCVIIKDSMRTDLIGCAE